MELDLDDRCQHLEQGAIDRVIACDTDMQGWLLGNQNCLVIKILSKL